MALFIYFSIFFKNFATERNCGNSNKCFFFIAKTANIQKIPFFKFLFGTKAKFKKRQCVVFVFVRSF